MPAGAFTMQIVVSDDPLGGGLVVPIGGSRTGLVVVTIMVVSLSPAATDLTSPTCSGPSIVRPANVVGGNDARLRIGHDRHRGRPQLVEPGPSLDSAVDEVEDQQFLRYLSPHEGVAAVG